MFRHVLIPVDSRSLPKTALITAAVLSNEQDAELTVLCVNDDDETRVFRALDNAKAIIAEFGSSASTMYATHNEPAERAIKNAAAVLDADVIVLGTSARRGSLHSLSRKVADTLLRESPIPVVFVNESSTNAFPQLFRDRRKPSTEP